MSKTPYKVPAWITISSYMLYIIGLACVLFIVYAIISPMFYSEERRSEIVAEREAAQAQRIADLEDQLRERAVEAVGNLYYIQDSRTGICFAVRSVYRLGHLAHVDCEAVPANMLLVTE